MTVMCLKAKVRGGKAILLALFFQALQLYQIYYHKCDQDHTEYRYDRY